ncbi:MAG: aminodeoxychorismate synthase component I, partial [Bacteroidia bacterium]|nr:aminodeoxychorismate synthase component I [Bacteroidia bacterium]
MTPSEFVTRMNNQGKQGKPFAFVVDFEMKKPLLFESPENVEKLWFQIPGFSNTPEHVLKSKNVKWKTAPVSFNIYKSGFELIKRHILNGDTYLLNFTQPTPVQTNCSLEEIFRISSARYKIFLKDEFICFSPETFIKTENRKIFSFPMKGTIDAEIENAEYL